MVMADPSDLGHGKKGCLMVMADPSDRGHGKNSLKSDAIASSFDSFITPIVSYNKFSNFSNTIRGNHINTGRFRQYSL